MTKRLKITHFDTDDLENPLAGGQPVRTYEVNRRIAKIHDITVYTSVYKNSRNALKEKISYKRAGCYIKPFGLSPHLSFLIQAGPRTLLTPHDLVIEEFMPPVGFSLIPLWTSRPVITIVQWFFFDFWEKKYHLPFKKIMKLIAATGLYRYFIVQTDAMGRKIGKYIPGAVVQKIPCGINKSDIIVHSVYRNFALFLGRLDKHQKGLDMLVKIWKKISDKHRIPLVIAGDGPFRTELEKEFSKAGITDLITFTGKVSGSRKEQLLATCRFLVMPSREETFGITALEAMAASKPVIVFDIDNLNEVVRPEWGEIIDKFDLDLFAERTMRLWKNHPLCIGKGNKGKKAALSFLWDNIAKMQNNFYQKIIKIGKRVQ